MEIQGSYDVRGKDLDTIFATSFTSDRCLSAIIAAQQRFHPSFPGWALYRRLLVGDDLLDRTLIAYAIGMARMVARARKLNGRRVVPITVKGSRWLRQAALDGLDYALVGRYPCGVNKRAEQFGMSSDTYQRVRDTVGWGLWMGADAFASEAKYQYRKQISRANSDGL
jgi:hypothetical protein